MVRLVESVYACTTLPFWSSETHVTPPPSAPYAAGEHPVQDD